MKANNFAKADEAVSPVIGVILMVAITVVLAAVVFVLVSDLSDTGDKSEDVAIRGDSPKNAEIWLTMIRGGEEAPYVLDGSAPADAASVTIDAGTCVLNTDFTSDDANWDGGDVLQFTEDCNGNPLVSGQEYTVQVTIRGSLVFSENIVVS